VIAERGHRRTANLKVFADSTVFGDARLDFITQTFIDGALASDCGLTRGFSTAARFFPSRGVVPDEKRRISAASSRLLSLRPERF
jgi:hypothetical protein